ncbi:MAG TPA: hypothetical protein VGR90_07475, partial [Acidimicrobiales bacterium]|nr:hypothetical protein [Acidimicrobiales bacterium]
LVVADLRRADEAASRCDLLMAVGSSLSVHPAAGLVPVAKASGAAVVIVNAEPTAYDHLADVVVRGPISVLLPDIVGAPPAMPPAPPQAGPASTEPSNGAP